MRRVPLRPALARNEWSSVLPTIYPCVPGHEIVGRVAKVGPKVTKFKIGDLAGVGCMVDADMSCPLCRAGNEHYSSTQVMTYGSGDDKFLGLPTYGGYSESIVLNEHFALHIPGNLDPRRGGAAPLRGHHDLFAAAPLEGRSRAEGRRRRHRGLGHMGVKFAHAFGAHVVVFTTSPGKRDDALRLGADEVVVSRDAGEMAKHAGTFDFILDCVSADHDLNATSPS